MLGLIFAELNSFLTIQEGAFPLSLLCSYSDQSSLKPIRIQGASGPRRLNGRRQPPGLSSAFLRLCVFQQLPFSPRRRSISTSHSPASSASTPLSTSQTSWARTTPRWRPGSARCSSPPPFSPRSSRRRHPSRQRDGPRQPRNRDAEETARRARRHDGGARRAGPPNARRAGDDGAPGGPAQAAPALPRRGVPRPPRRTRVGLVAAGGWRSPTPPSLRC